MESPIIIKEIRLGKFMYKMMCLIVFIFLSTSLKAYEKKIIIVSFSEKKKAQRMFDKLPKQHHELYKLVKDHSLDFKMRKSGEYYVILVEVFQDKEVLNSIVKKLRAKFNGAYVTNYYPESLKEEQTSSSLGVQKIEEPEENIISKTLPLIVSNEEEKKPVEIHETVEENTSVYQIFQSYVSQEKQKLDAFFNHPFLKKYFEWYYVVLAFFTALLIHYYIKLKRIYDSY